MSDLVAALREKWLRVLARWKEVGRDVRARASPSLERFSLLHAIHSGDEAAVDRHAAALGESLADKAKWDRLQHHYRNIRVHYPGSNAATEASSPLSVAVRAVWFAVERRRLAWAQDRLHGNPLTTVHDDAVQASRRILGRLLAGGLNPEAWIDPETGATVLHDAAFVGDPETIRILIQHGSDADRLARQNAYQDCGAPAVPAFHLLRSGKTRAGDKAMPVAGLDWEPTAREVAESMRILCSASTRPPFRLLLPTALKQEAWSVAGVLLACGAVPSADDARILARAKTPDPDLVTAFEKAGARWDRAAEERWAVDPAAQGLRLVRAEAFAGRLATALAGPGIRPSRRRL